MTASPLGRLGALSLGVSFLISGACADPKTKSPPSNLDTSSGGNGGTATSAASTSPNTSSITSTNSSTTNSSIGGTTSTTGSGGNGGGAGDNGDASGGNGGTGGEVVLDPCGSAGAGGEPQSGDELFFEDFESDLDRWEFSEGTTWNVVLDDESSSNAIGNGEIINQPRVAYVSDACYTDVIVEARVKVLEFPGSSTTSVAGPCLRVESDEDYYIVGVQGNGNAGLVRVSNGSRSSLQSDGSVDLVEDQWYTVRIEAVGSELRGYIDDELLLEDDDSQLTFGSIGVCTSNADAIFDDVRVTLP